MTTNEHCQVVHCPVRDLHVVVQEVVGKFVVNKGIYQPILIEKDKDITSSLDEIANLVHALHVVGNCCNVGEAHAQDYLVAGRGTKLADESVPNGPDNGKTNFLGFRTKFQEAFALAPADLVGVFRATFAARRKRTFWNMFAKFRQIRTRRRAWRTEVDHRNVPRPLFGKFCFRRRWHKQLSNFGMPSLTSSL